MCIYLGNNLAVTTILFVAQAQSVDVHLFASFELFKVDAKLWTDLQTLNS